MVRVPCSRTDVIAIASPLMRNVLHQQGIVKSNTSFGKDLPVVKVT